MSSDTGVGRPAARRGMGRKQKRLIIIAGIGAVLALALALIFMALGNQIVYFYTPSDAAIRNLSPGQPIRLGGLVQEGSWQKAGNGNTFVVSDGRGEVTAHFTGILPDLFREGQGVVAEGSMGSDGIFNATNVLAKHDENYIPKQIVDEMKKRGDWRPDDPQAALEALK